eukprot:8276-Chlamydomonas_euryale.AAC.1
MPFAPAGPPSFSAPASRHRTTFAIDAENLSLRSSTNGEPRSCDMYGFVSKCGEQAEGRNMSLRSSTNGELRSCKKCGCVRKYGEQAEGGGE